MRNYKLPILIRQPAILTEQSNDLDFIYSSWIKCVLNQKPYSVLDKSWLNAAQHSIITRLLRNCDVLIACDPQDIDQLFGYIVFDKNKRTLHWVYCKYDFRKTGVATKLMLEAFNNFEEPIEYTFESTAIKYHVKRWNLKMNTHRLVETGRLK